MKAKKTDRENRLKQIYTIKDGRQETKLFIFHFPGKIFYPTNCIAACDRNQKLSLRTFWTGHCPCIRAELKAKLLLLEYFESFFYLNLYIFETLYALVHIKTQITFHNLFTQITFQLQYVFCKFSLPVVPLFSPYCRACNSDG